MRVAHVEFVGLSPFQQGRHHGMKKREEETHDDCELRTWMYRSHYNHAGEIFIPANMIKNCLTNGAKYLSIKIPGEGQAKYTKNFEAGILVMEHVYLGIQRLENLNDEKMHISDYAERDDIYGVGVFGDSKGRRGGTGTRVMKYFPTIPEYKWGGTFVVYILDDKITDDVFAKVVEGSGKFMGLGVYRPQNIGTNGRFGVTNITMKEEEFSLAM